MRLVGPPNINLTPRAFGAVAVGGPEDKKYYQQDRRPCIAGPRSHIVLEMPRRNGQLAGFWLKIRVLQP